MSKHIEVKVVDAKHGERNVVVKTFYRRYPPNGGIIPGSVRQWTVPLDEFERALNEVTIEVPWKGLL